MFNPFQNDLDGLTEKDLNDTLPKLTETWWVEYKGPKGITDSDAIAKAVASFANTHGGWLFIGVNADTATNKPLPGGIVGLPAAEADTERIYQVCSSRLSPAPYFVCNPVPLADGNQVLAVHVPESPDPPHIDIPSGRVYVRTGDTSHPIKQLDGRGDLDRLYDKALRNEEKAAQVLSRLEGGAALVRYSQEMRDQFAVLAPGALHGSDAWLTWVFSPATYSPALFPWALDSGFPDTGWPGKQEFRKAGYSVQLDGRRLTQQGVFAFGAVGGYYVDAFGLACFAVLLSSVQQVPSMVEQTGLPAALAASVAYKAAGYYGRVRVNLHFGDPARTYGPVERPLLVAKPQVLEVGTIEHEVRRVLGQYDK